MRGSNLNITAVSYGGSFSIGLVACPDNVDDVALLARGIEDAVGEIKRSPRTRPDGGSVIVPAHRTAVRAGVGRVTDELMEACTFSARTLGIYWGSATGCQIHRHLNAIRAWWKSRPAKGRRKRCDQGNPTAHPDTARCISLIHALAGTRAKLIRQRAELDAQLRGVPTSGPVDWQISQHRCQRWLTSVAATRPTRSDRRTTGLLVCNARRRARRRTVGR